MGLVREVLEREQTLVVSGRTKIIRKENGRHYIKGNCDTKTNRGEDDKNIFPLWWAEVWERKVSILIWVYLNSCFRIRKKKIFTLLNEFFHCNSKTEGQKKRSCVHITPIGEQVPYNKEKQCNSEKGSIFRMRFNLCLEIQVPMRKNSFINLHTGWHSTQYLDGLSSWGFSHWLKILIFLPVTICFLSSVVLI